MTPGWTRALHGLALMAISLGGAPAGAAERSVRVGIYENPPKLTADGDGLPSGILGDLLREMARQEDWQLVGVTCEWDDCLARLEAGTIDLMPDVAWSEGRAKLFGFHQVPVLHSWSQVFARPGAAIQSMLDLEGKRLVVLENSVQQEYLGNLLAGFGVDVRMLPVRSYDEGFALVARGGADAVAANHHFGEIEAGHHGLVETTLMFQPSRLFYATARGRNQDLRDGIDRHLRDWLAVPGSKYFEIVERWGAAPMPARIPTLFWLGLAVLAALLLLALVFVALLRREVARQTRDLRAKEDKLASILRLESYDNLTRLPNRRLLLERLQQWLGGDPIAAGNSALLLLNLDGFKSLNERHGHAVGDRLLQQVAERMLGCMQAHDLAARIASDEFAALVAAPASSPGVAAQMLDRRARDLQQAVSGTPFDLGSMRYQASASIGMVHLGESSGGVDAVLTSADLALHQAKASGGNAICHFRPDMEALAGARVALEAELREAIADAQFVLHYQPQVDIAHGLIGVEALVRWQHPQRGLIGPDTFIPLAEVSGLIDPLGRWILEAACRQLCAWADADATRALLVAVNISARQLHHADFVDMVLDTLATTGANPQRLELELTESQLVEDIDGAIAKMRTLRERGVRVSLDDFGTGYSSLNYLGRLPLDQLKIDQAFVRDLLLDANDNAIVRAMVSIGASLDVPVLAEGVETAAQRDALLKLGCRRFQGYLFGKPAPASEVIERWRALALA